MTIVNTKKRRDLRRVQMTDDLFKATCAVGENLIGNVTWLTELVMTRPAPANLMRLPIGHLVSIDDMGVYGEHLWDLFKHVLDGDLDNFVLMSDALQADRITRGEIREAAREPKNAKLKKALWDKAGITSVETSVCQ